MKLQEMTLEVMLSEIGRAEPSISGSTASLAAAQLGAAMARMALSVSAKHGEDNDAAIERLDSLVSRIADAAEQDRAASAALMNCYRHEADENARGRAIADATREPLSTAHLLIELMEHLNEAQKRVHRSVKSDFFGGVELISAAFAAVMMAVESNIRQDLAFSLNERTANSRSSLRLRHKVVMAALQSIP